jgi:hypothetical protein
MTPRPVLNTRLHHAVTTGESSTAAPRRVSTPLSLNSAPQVTNRSKGSPAPSIGPIRGAQTGVFQSDIRISNLPFIDLYTASALETGRKCSNVENRINGCLSRPIAVRFANTYTNRCRAQLHPGVVLKTIDRTLPRTARAIPMPVFCPKNPLCALFAVSRIRSQFP